MFWFMLMENLEVTVDVLQVVGGIPSNKKCWIKLSSGEVTMSVEVEM